MSVPDSIEESGTVRKNLCLEPNVDTAPVIVWIFQMRLNGYALARITRALNDAGVAASGLAFSSKSTCELASTIVASVPLSRGESSHPCSTVPTCIRDARSHPAPTIRPENRSLGRPTGKFGTETHVNGGPVLVHGNRPMIHSFE